MENALELNEKKFTGKKTSVILFIACFLTYACAYIARGNYSIVINDMKTNGIINDNIAGLISGIYFAFYALGQFTNGLIADKKNPFYMVLIGIAIIILSNVAMTVFYKPSFLLVLWWGLNGVGQSMLWTPIFSIIGTALNPDMKFTFLTVIALATPVGKLSGYFVSGLALDLGGKIWKSVFYAAALIMLVVLAFWLTTFLSVKKKLVFVQKEEKKEEEKKGGLWQALVLSGTAILLPSLIVHGLFLNGAVEWVPTIIQNNYGVSKSVSSYVMMIIPAIGTLGVLFGNFLYKKFGKDEIKCSVLVMGMSLLFVAILFAMSFSSGNLLGKIPECILFVLIFGLMYTVQLSFNHLMISLFPMKFAGLGLAASVSGLLNAVNYGGSAISTYGMSFIVDNYVVLFAIWAATLVIAIVSLILSKKKVREFSKNNQGV